MYRRLFLFGFLFLVLFTANAQNKTLSGIVADAATGESLINATVVNGTSGSLTNEYGFYSLTVPQGQQELMVSYVGYKSEKIVLSLLADTAINFRLTPATELDEVNVVSQQEHLIQRKNSSAYVMSAKEMSKLPVMLGEPDVIKAVQLLPGVQACNEASGGLMVRGGGTDGNLILLDDVPIFNVSHLLGLFSVFDPNVLKSVQFYNGDFPAKYGGRSSSVLDLRLKDGDKYEFHSDVSVGLVSSKILLEGPIIKEKLSFLFSARRTYLDVPLSLYQKIENPEYSDYRQGFYFYDVIGKVSWSMGTKDRLFFSVYTGKDNNYYQAERDTTHKDNSSMQWGNITTAVRWNKQWSPKLFSNLTATSTNYYYQAVTDNLSSDSVSYNAYKYNFTSGVKNYSLKYDANYYANSNLKFEFGGFANLNAFNTGKSTVEVQTERKGDAVKEINQSTPYACQEYGAYGSTTFTLANLFHSTLGTRYVYYHADGKGFKYLEPRINFSLTPRDLPLSANISYSIMHQPMHLLSNYGISLPVDLWVPATQQFEPIESDQFNAGIMYRWSTITASLAIYKKNMNNLIDYKVGEGFSAENLNWSEKVVGGEGRSQGLEFYLEKNQGTLSGNIAYTLSKTENKVEGIRNGEWYPSVYDHRHEFKVNANYKLNSNINFSAVWIFGTGGAVTVPDSKYYLFSGKLSNYSNEPYLLYGERNSSRMPAYHRLDVGVNFEKENSRGLRIWSMGVYNLYNRANPYFLTYTSNYTNSELSTNSLLPILPYVTYRFKF